MSNPSKKQSHKRPLDVNEGSDDEQFHPLPKEQPNKKQKKQQQQQQSSQPVQVSIAEQAMTMQQKTAFKQQTALSQKQGQKGALKVQAKVPVLGGDDEDMDSGASDNDSEADGTQQKEVKMMTKTELKAARVYERPAKAAGDILPNPNTRTPAHTNNNKSSTSSAPSSSSITDASSQMLAPLASVTSGSLSTTQSALRKVIVVLVKASLETVKTKKGYELVSADSHKHILQKLKKNPSEYRPDILHQCLLTLLDSPLNKAGLLQVYVQTEKNVLIEVHSSIRIPRTFKRFAGLMVQLLHKLKIRSSDSSDMLLKVIRNPITDHLPVGALKIGTSVTGDLVDIRELAENVIGANPTAPVVFCVGSHASGPAEVDWTDKSIAISKYPLSASVALGRMCNAFEGIWNIL